MLLGQNAEEKLVEETRRHGEWWRKENKAKDCFLVQGTCSIAEEDLNVNSIVNVGFKNETLAQAIKTSFSQ